MKWKRTVAIILVLFCCVFNPAQAEGVLAVIQEIDPNIIIDLRYATSDNFVGEPIYRTAAGLLRQETAEKLAKANTEFGEQGYRIKVWDAYRPFAVQQRFWDLVHDERYVANPATGGSRHNRGGAVDITLVDGAGTELVMPSGFDDFTYRAWRSSGQMDEAARKNMEYLTAVMIKHGFRAIDTEWWHFEDVDSESFELLNTSFEDIIALHEPFEHTFLPASCEQVLLVESVTNEGSRARVLAFEKIQQRWIQKYGPWDSMIGRNGFAPPMGKVEGDGKTPSGVYDLSLVFGYQPMVDTAMPYRQSLDTDYWIDEPTASTYNQWVSGEQPTVSHEIMRRPDHLYKYGVVIDYNRNPVIPGKGSAIFLHLWRDEETPTAGCVALSEEHIVRLIQWLTPEKNPVIILNNTASL